MDLRKASNEDCVIKKKGRPDSFKALRFQELDFKKAEDLMLVHGRYDELSEHQMQEMQRLER